MKKKNLDTILDILKRNKDIMSQRHGVTEIAVFGSYVSGTQSKKSDLDIFVGLKQGHKTFDNYMELKFFLEKITSMTIDLVIKESVRKELKPAIFRKAVHA